MRRNILGAIIVVATITATMVGVAAQGRRDTTSTSSVSLKPPATASTDGLWPHLGDWVTFNATYPKQVEKYDVSIQIVCYQSGGVVYAESRPWSQSFLLGAFASDWVTIGGSADCVADLYYWTFGGGQKFNWLASTSFAAAAKD